MGCGPSFEEDLDKQLLLTGIRKEDQSQFQTFFDYEQPSKAINISK